VSSRCLFVSLFFSARQVGVCTTIVPFTNTDNGVGDYDTSWGWCLYRAQRFHGDGGGKVRALPLHALSDGSQCAAYARSTWDSPMAWAASSTEEVPFGLD
jgi:hypothetical protein